MLCIVTEAHQRHDDHVDADPDGDHGDEVMMMMMLMGMFNWHALT